MEKVFANSRKPQGRLGPVTSGCGIGTGNSYSKSAYKRHLSGNSRAGPVRLAGGVGESEQSGQIRKNSGVVKAEGGSKLNTKFF